MKKILSLIVICLFIVSCSLTKGGVGKTTLPFTIIVKDTENNIVVLQYRNVKRTIINCDCIPDSVGIGSVVNLPISSLHHKYSMTH